MGQVLRSLAMIHASRSFSHVVKVIKHDDHVLITNGVYRYVLVQSQPHHLPIRIDKLIIQILPTPLIRWLLLLGIGDPAFARECSIDRRIRLGSRPFLLRTHHRYVSHLLHYYEPSASFPLRDLLPCHMLTIRRRATPRALFWQGLH